MFVDQNNVPENKNGIVFDYNVEQQVLLMKDGILHNAE